MPKEFATQDPEAKKLEIEQNYRDTLRKPGNLSEEEITELVKFEIHDGPKTVDEQVRLHYLKLKSESPEKAEKMQSEVEPIVKRGVESRQDLEDLCLALNRYSSGFVINFGGRSYSVRQGKMVEI